MKTSLTAADILFIVAMVILLTSFFSWANEFTYEDRVYLFNIRWNHMLGLRPIA